MSQDDFYFRVFLRFVRRSRYAKDAAKQLKLSKSYLSRLMSGQRLMSKALAKRFGYVRTRHNGEYVYQKG